MLVKVVGREQIERDINEDLSVKDVIRMMKIREDHYVTLLNGSPAADDDVAGVNDELVFLEVFSGG